MASLSPDFFFFLILAINSKKRKSKFSGSALFHMKNRICAKYFLNDFLCKLFYVSNLQQNAGTLMCLTNLVTVKTLTQF